MANVNMSFDGNSHKSQTKKKEKVTKGAVHVGGKEHKGFWETFFEDDVDDIMDFVLEDVLKPAIKNLVYDVFVGSLERALFGGGSRKRIGDRRNEVTNYSGRYKYGNHSSRRDDDISSSGSNNPEDILFGEREDAYKVIRSLHKQIKDYGKATVGDFFDFAGITPNDNYQRNERYGWRALNEDLKPRMARGGRYYIPLPPAKSL